MPLGRRSSPFPGGRSSCPQGSSARLGLEFRILPVRNHLPAGIKNLAKHGRLQRGVRRLHLDAVNSAPHGADGTEHVQNMRRSGIDYQILSGGVSCNKTGGARHRKCSNLGCIHSEFGEIGTPNPFLARAQSSVRTATQLVNFIETSFHSLNWSGFSVLCNRSSAFYSKLAKNPSIISFCFE